MSAYCKRCVVTLYLLFASGMHSQRVPDQIHLSLTGSLDTVVTWSTKDSISGSSIVKYGISRTALNQHARATSNRFVDGGKEKRSQYIHKATLTNLKQETVYYYKCGSSYGWSDIFSFKTLSKSNSFAPRFAIYGDLGLVNPQSLPRLTQEAEAGNFDMILHVGDLAYDMDTNNSKVGDQFMRMIQPVATHVPYLTCPGNHENRYNFSNYKARFSMPGRSEDMFYSFNIGPAHIISLSTEFYYYVYYGFWQIPNQFHWLQKDLEEANRPENRGERPWIITMGHRPMYCSNLDKDDCTDSVRDVVRRGYGLYYGLEKLFYDQKVDLEIWAHEHSYERLWPTYNLKVYNGSAAQPYKNPKAPVHVITGSAGCQERTDKFVKNPQEWSAFRSSDYGFSRMTIQNKTHLSFQQISDDKDGEVIDQFVLIKTY